MIIPDSFPMPRPALPQALDGCTCVCHRCPGVRHVSPCCGPGGRRPLVLDKPKPRLKYVVCVRYPDSCWYIARLCFVGENGNYTTLGYGFTLRTRLVAPQQRDAGLIPEVDAHQ